MSRTTFTRDINDAAVRVSLNADVVEALVIVESGGNPDAWNPEPRYRWLWNVRTGKPFRDLTLEESLRATPPSDFPCLAGDPDQEWTAQRASWGLMQVMGAVAREQGFMTLYLTKLTNPQANLSHGTKLLATLLKRANGNVKEALGAYNAGWGGRLSVAGVQYATKVLDTMHGLGRLQPALLED